MTAHEVCMACRPARRGFTLLEMLIAIILALIAAAMLVPMMTSNSSSYVSAGMGLVIADLDFAQSTAINDPSDNIVVHFDPALGRWWVTRESTPDVILTMSSGEPYDTTMGVGRADMAIDVAFTLSGADDNKVVYNAFGTLAQDAEITINFSSGSALGQIVIDAETGFLAAQ